MFSTLGIINITNFRYSNVCSCILRFLFAFDKCLIILSIFSMWLLQYRAHIYIYWAPWDYFFWLLIIELQELLLFLDTSPLSDICFEKKYLPICYLCFHFPQSVFQKAEVYILMKYKYLCNCFMVHAYF